MLRLEIFVTLTQKRFNMKLTTMGMSTSYMLKVVGDAINSMKQIPDEQNYRDLEFSKKKSSNGNYKKGKR